MKKITLFIIAVMLITGISCKKEKDISPVALSIERFYPNSGNAGTIVNILGTGFNKEALISFAGTQGEVINVNDTVLVVRVPENGKSGIITYSTDNKITDVGNYTYQALSVQSIFPFNGPAGTHLRISGAGFSSLKAPAEVLINGRKATVVSASDTLLVAEIPDEAGSGPVTVNVDGKTSVGPVFRFQSITGIKPLTGGAGTKVIINGVGFETAATVDFNGKPAVVVEVTEGKLTVMAPEGITTGPISVTINGQKTTGPAFTIVAPPKITQVSPLSGPAGQEMTITGLNFSAIKDENKVSINGTVVPVKTALPNKLTLTIPGGTGSGILLLSVNDQQVQGPSFTDQTLGILSLLPANGLAGTEVTITGTGFSTVAADNTVTFNGVTATIVSVTETSLVVTAPSGLSTGPVKVRRAAAEAQSPVPFFRAGMQTLAGGPSSAVLDNTMNGIAVDSKGNVYVTSGSNYNIHKITPDGTVSLFAGSATHEYGRKDGPVADALFSSITGIVIDPQDNIYVYEYGNGNSIRKISAGIVTTFKTDISNLTRRMTIDNKGNLYLTEGYMGIRRVYPDGATDRTYTLSVSDDCRPAVDATGNIYFVPDPYEAYMGLYTVGGTSTMRWLGSSIGYADGPMGSALFSYGLNSLLIDKDGNLLILDKNNFAIRKLDFNTKEVSTVMQVSQGYEDGSFNNAKMSFATDMTIDKDGNIYLLDQVNQAVRKVLLK